MKCSHTVVTASGFEWKCDAEHQDEHHYMIRVASASLAS